MICIRKHDVSVTGRYQDGHCTACRREDSYVYKSLHRRETIAAARKWNMEHPEQVKANRRKYSWRREKITNSNGTPFTPLDYDRLYQLQLGKCRICGVHSTCLSRRLDADHDHTTGMIRGLLCSLCNVRLGQYESFKERATIYFKGFYL